MSKQFLLAFFGSTLFCYLALVGVNVKIDSACVLGCEGIIGEAARAVRKGHSVSGLQNFDHRIFQKLLINLSDKTPQMIVLGSSRSMQLSHDFFGLPQDEFFNHSVSAAFIEDHLGLLAIYDQRGEFPKRILFGIDPWIFNRVDPHSNWKTIADECYSLKKKLQGAEEESTWWSTDRFFSKLKTLSSFSYLKINLTLNDKVGELLLDQSPENNAKDIINPDGSWTIPATTRIHDQTKTMENLDTYQSYLKNYDQISDLDLFEKLITYLHKRGSKVEFFLSPYHPRGYELVQKDSVYRIVLQVEKELRALAGKHNIPVYGSYDPGVVGLTEKDFYDGIHAYGSSVKKFFPEIK